MWAGGVGAEAGEMGFDGGEVFVADPPEGADTGFFGGVLAAFGHVEEVVAAEELGERDSTHVLRDRDEVLVVFLSCCLGCIADRCALTKRECVCVS